MIVLDTNVISELMRAAPADRVVRWVTSRPGDALNTTSITVAEVRYSLVRLPSGRRRELLMAAADDVFSAFQDRVLPFAPRRPVTTPASWSSVNKPGLRSAASTPRSRLSVEPATPSWLPATPATSPAWAWNWSTPGRPRCCPPNCRLRSASSAVSRASIGPPTGWSVGGGSWTPDMIRAARSAACPRRRWALAVTRGTG